jgi:serine/threonine-protein kinase HipA
VSTAAPAARQTLQVCIGEAGIALGQLHYIKQGQREHSSFAYDPAWLAADQRFEVSPDLPLIAGHQPRRAAGATDSGFHGALADTAPDAWGRRVIARAHARQRRRSPGLATLTELDYLAAVDDFSRVGALRLRHEQGEYLGQSGQGARTTPPLVELSRMLGASRAVESSQETAEDLRYLLGKGTSLGGMRPKCTLLDDNGRLAIGKFPSIGDERSVTRGEVLAMRLARKAGIDTAPARIVALEQAAVAVIERFDRGPSDGREGRIPYRIPYLSAASLLQAQRDGQGQHSYAELADAIRARCSHPAQDVMQLWRRLMFNLLITNVDDHLHNHAFLYSGQGQWRLAPAFDLNPFPDKDRESKTWLMPDSGPIDSLAMLMEQAPYFGLTEGAALKILAQVHRATSAWRAEARSPAVGLRANELRDFAPAFEHEAAETARKVLGR